VLGCCTKLFAVLAVAAAALVGWLLSFEHPIAPIFAYVHLAEGLLKPKTEAVPADFAPQGRPEGEMFLPLASGARMPANGIGMCCRHTAYDDESVRRTVLWYLLQGGRHIDTADIYMNHVAVGQAIREAGRRGVPRSELFVTTKVWPDSFGHSSAKAAVRRFLQELDLDYIDLILMHAPRNMHPRLYLNLAHGWEDEFKNHDCKTASKCRAETWRALSELVGEGAVRDIGVSNFRVEYMEELRALGLQPISAHQMQYHPWAPESMRAVVAYCHQHGIAVTAYFSLGGLKNANKALNMDAVSAVAAAHGRPAGQVLLRWALEKNVSVIPGTGNPKHMRENLDVYGFSLSGEEMAKLDALSSDPLAEEFLFFFMDW